MAFYGLNYLETRKLPLATFWMLSRNIDRINSEADIRRATLMLRTQGDQEAVKELFEDLRRTMGKVVQFDEGRQAMRAAVRDVISREDKAALNAIGDLSNVRPGRAGT